MRTLRRLILSHRSSGLFRAKDRASDRPAQSDVQFARLLPRAASSGRAPHAHRAAHSDWRDRCHGRRASLHVPHHHRVPAARGRPAQMLLGQSGAAAAARVVSRGSFSLPGPGRPAVRCGKAEPLVQMLFIVGQKNIMGFRPCFRHPTSKCQKFL